MKLYGISGLGADSRVFDYLTLDYELIPIEWIEPKNREPIEDYSMRLSEVIDKSEEFAILGVSFGGLVAVEISKVLNPKLTILISSAETKNELRPIIRAVGKTSLINLIPFQLFDPPRKIAHFLFGTSKKELLNRILDDTDLRFVKWAVTELVKWKNEERIGRAIKISGTKDKLIPPIKNKEINLVEGGEHLMIVDKARVISEIINTRIKTMLQY